jgi:hypothetical protein
MFSVCPECGKEVTINEMPAPGEVLQAVGPRGIRVDGGHAQG